MIEIWWRDGQVCPDVAQGIMAPWAGRLGRRGKKREEPCTGWAIEKDLVREWREKEGKTMNAGGVEE
ncbi:hypothetical protein TNCV_2709951 [Trichonephila clavipes]|nr:hypothetical protein TNCV_2709951 [Trichonephila clavipes]